MDFASLELCQEIYELTGWADWSTHAYDFDTLPGDESQRLPFIYTRPLGQPIPDGKYPAYTTSYLLDHLPRAISLFGYHQNIQIESVPALWTAGYAVEGHTLREAHHVASNPRLADAVANLVIRLKKSGISLIDQPYAKEEPHNRITA